MAGATDSLPPRCLYKYRSLCDSKRLEAARSLVVDRVLYLAPPGTFEDPEDGLPDLERPARASGNVLPRLMQHFGADAKKNVEPSLRFGLNTSIGVCSLTDDGLRGDMWQEYGEHHRGICVELDGRALAKFVREHGSLLLWLQGIAYEPLLADSVERALWHKRDQFAFEREWRLVREFGPKSWPNSPRHLSMPPGVVRRVLLGRDISPEHAAVVTDWTGLAGLPPPTRVVADPKTACLQLQNTMRRSARRPTARIHVAPEDARDTRHSVTNADLDRMIELAYALDRHAQDNRRPDLLAAYEEAEHLALEHADSAALVFVYVPLAVKVVNYFKSDASAAHDGAWTDVQESVALRLAILYDDLRPRAIDGPTRDDVLWRTARCISASFCISFFDLEQFTDPDVVWRDAVAMFSGGIARDPGQRGPERCLLQAADRLILWHSARRRFREAWAVFADVNRCRDELAVAYDPLLTSLLLLLSADNSAPRVKKMALVVREYIGAVSQASEPMDPSATERATAILFVLEQLFPVQGI